jgi:hypothetical protein
MKYILLTILPLFLYAKIDFNLQAHKDFYANLYVSSSYSMDTTNLTIKSDTIDINQNFDYDSQYSHIQFEGSLGYLNFDINYEKNSEDAYMSSNRVSIDNTMIPLLWIGKAENKNSVSFTTEDSFGFYGLFENSVKDFTLSHNDLQATFRLVSSRISTEHLFFTLAKQSAERNEDFNFFGLAFASNRSGFKSYGSAYYAFASVKLQELDYKDSKHTVTQTKDVSDSGFLVGYRLDSNFHTKYIDFHLSARIEQVVFDKEETRVDPLIDISVTKMQVYASLLYRF